MSEYSKVEQSEELSFIKLRGMVKALEEYNKEHGWGAMFAAGLAGGLEKNSEGESEGERKRRKSLSDAIKANNEASNLGLELNFGTNKSITMFTSTEAGVAEPAHPLEIRIYVIEGEALLKFLNKIDKVDFEKYPDLKKDILTIIKYTSRQIADPDSTEDRIASLVSVGTKILHEFDRLGFGKDIENLSESLVNAQGGTLNELRALRAVKCLEKPDARVFGPSDWHKDMLIEEYKRRWSETKRVVLDTLQNKNAIMLARKAMENLIANADYAIKNMEEKIVSSPDMTEGYKRAQLEYVKTCQEYKAVYEDLLSKVEEPELN